MRRIFGIGLLAAALVLVTVAPARAATATVVGTAAYKKLVINNGATALVFKLTAPGGPCAVKYVAVKFKDKSGTQYTADGGCYGADTWIASLARGKRLVTCAGYKLTYATAAHVWTAAVPRTCMKDLKADIKVTSSWVDDWTTNPGEAGPSGWVAQG